MKNERCPICFKVSPYKNNLQPIYDMQTKLGYCSVACLDVGRAFDSLERDLARRRAALARDAFEKLDAEMRQILAEEKK